jgi:hypothetical protein
MIALAEKIFGRENSSDTKGESSKKDKDDDKGKVRRMGSRGSLTNPENKYRLIMKYGSLACR